MPSPLDVALVYAWPGGHVAFVMLRQVLSLRNRYDPATHEGVHSSSLFDEVTCPRGHNSHSPLVFLKLFGGVHGWFVVEAVVAVVEDLLVPRDVIVLTSTLSGIQYVTVGS